MTKKRWLKTSFISVVLMIFIIGTFNYVVDPFQQYRVDTFYPVSYTAKLERYTNPGFAKNYEYDTVVLGSSVSENFIISDIKEILDFKKPIKLCISGTSAYEESLTLQTALSHKKIKNVIFGLDTFLFRGAPNRTRYNAQSFPFHLYDNNIWNDYKYIFSLDTTFKSLERIKELMLDDHSDVKYDYNKMYQWQDGVPDSYFSTKHVMEIWKERANSAYSHQPKHSFEYYRKSFDVNFLSIFKDNPKTSFIIFFPPYSILTYKYEQEIGLFDDISRFKKYIVEVTNNLANVEIYDFQIAKEITYNLANYRDLDHYHQSINEWILKQIKNKNFKMNSNNIDNVLEKQQNDVLNYQVVNNKRAL